MYIIQLHHGKSRKTVSDLNQKDLPNFKSCRSFQVHTRNHTHTFAQSQPCFEQFLRGCPFSRCWCGSCVPGRHDTLRQGLSSGRPRSMQSMLVLRWMHSHYKISQSNVGRFACNCHSAALLGRAHASLRGRREIVVPLKDRCKVVHRGFCLLNVIEGGQASGLRPWAIKKKFRCRGCHVHSYRACFLLELFLKRRWPQSAWLKPSLRQ